MHTTCQDMNLSPLLEQKTLSELKHAKLLLQICPGILLFYFCWVFCGFWEGFFVGERFHYYRDCFSGAGALFVWGVAVVVFLGILFVLFRFCVCFSCCQVTPWWRWLLTRLFKSMVPWCTGCLSWNTQILCLAVQEQLNDSVAVLLQPPGENIRHEDHAGSYAGYGCSTTVFSLIRSAVIYPSSHTCSSGVITYKRASLC